MFKFVAVSFFALFAVAFGAANPGLLAPAAVAYNTPLAYTAGLPAVATYTAGYAPYIAPYASSYSAHSVAHSAAIPAAYTTYAAAPVVAAASPVVAAAAVPLLKK